MAKIAGVWHLEHLTPDARLASWGDRGLTRFASAFGTLCRSSQEATAISIAGGSGRALESPGNTARNKKPPAAMTIASANVPIMIFLDIAIPQTRAAPLWGTLSTECPRYFGCRLVGRSLPHSVKSSQRFDLSSFWPSPLKGQTTSHADYSSTGRLTASESHRARDRQQASMVGDAPGSSRSEPAGMIISRPLRVAWGSGEPQFRQNEVEKLRAVGRSKRTTPSSPDNQRNACGKT